MPAYFFSMAVHTPVILPGIYFITFICHRWLPLIDIVNGYDLVDNWVDVLSKRQHPITGYVIMPNHLHLLLHCGGGKQSLNTLIGNGKRFMLLSKDCNNKRKSCYWHRYNVALNRRIRSKAKNTCCG